MNIPNISAFTLRAILVPRMQVFMKNKTPVQAQIFCSCGNLSKLNLEKTKNEKLVPWGLSDHNRTSLVWDFSKSLQTHRLERERAPFSSSICFLFLFCFMGNLKWLWWQRERKMLWESLSFCLYCSFPFFFF